MIQISNLTLTYGTQEIFKNTSCLISQEEKIGLVGRNGAGKSTLLKVLAGYEKTDGGAIVIARGKKLAYLPQEVVFVSEKTVYEEAFSAFDDLDNDVRKLAELEEMLMRGDLYEVEDLELYAALHDRLSGGAQNNAKVQTLKVLTGLGFPPERQQQKVSELSVGWRMRVVLAKLLLQNADFYCFDEPTNHLDIVAKEWFLHFLKNSSFGYLLVSHDRYFLDHACTKMLEVERGKLTFYQGNFTKYIETKDAMREKLEAAAKLQQKEIETKEALIARFRAQPSKAAFARSLRSQIDRMEIIEVPASLPRATFSFPPVERTGSHVLKMKDVTITIGGKQLFKNTTAEVLRGEKIALLAPNGVGKTTLMNVLAGKMKQTGGDVTWGSNVTVAYFEQDQLRALNQNKTILEELLETCARNSEAEIRRMLGCFLFSGDSVHKKIKVLSGGEQNRVAMAKVLLQKSNVLLLDEPTNHLDLQSKHILLQGLRLYEGTIIVVSHDQDFLEKLPTRILELTTKGFNDYMGNYDAYVWHKEQEELKEKALAASRPVQAAAPEASAPSKETKNQHDRDKQRAALERKIEKHEHELEKLTVALSQSEPGSKDYHAIQDNIMRQTTELTALHREWETLVA